jgi:hypothetical protein
MTDKCPGAPAKLQNEQASSLFKPSQHIWLNEDYYTHYLFYYTYYFACLARIEQLVTSTAGRHTTIQLEVSCHGIKKQALLAVIWAQVMPFSFVSFTVYHYYFLLFSLFQNSIMQLGCIFTAENWPIGTSTTGDQ